MADKVYDYVIIGSGFGGSVSALRLAEKGYSVLVLAALPPLTALVWWDVRRGGVRERKRGT